MPLPRLLTAIEERGTKDYNNRSVRPTFNDFNGLPVYLLCRVVNERRLEGQPRKPAADGWMVPIVALQPCFYFGTNGSGSGSGQPRAILEGLGIFFPMGGPPFGPEG